MIAVVPPTAVLLYPAQILLGPDDCLTRDQRDWNRMAFAFNRGRGR